MCVHTYMRTCIHDDYHDGDVIPSRLTMDVSCSAFVPSVATSAEGLLAMCTADSCRVSPFLGAMHHDTCVRTTVHTHVRTYILM